jgi:UDP-N-acetylmuramoyl-L-alanyl-D-glutamate--2,6-diaminopimelate ligase
VQHDAAAIAGERFRERDHAMTWADLHDALVERRLVRADYGAHSDPSGFVTGVAYDSRAVEPGNVFVALKGQRADGSRFVSQAVERGATAIVSEDSPPSDISAPWSVVGDARLALAILAAAHFEHPSAEMAVVGITGTNGKTTTAYLTAAIFEAAGTRCGILGTVAYRVGREVREATRTTPEAPDVQSLLRDMVVAGCGACAMEVSSHALSLRRVDGIRFAAGVFTNLTRDHLDFHADMEDYFNAKRRLFELLPPHAPAVINLDDPRGAALAAAVPRPVTFAVNRAADVVPGPLSFSLEGLAFDIRTPRGGVQVRSPLVGRPNVYNILAAVATAMALDVPFDAIERGVRSLAGVPGRFEVVSSPRDEITVVVDYAHTDDALRNLLETARPLAKGRVVTVFGCGGDRDRTKRPLMGAVARRLSDVVVVTSDNPRSEDPKQIIEEICRGLVTDARLASSSIARPSSSNGADRANGSARFDIVEGRRSDEPRVLTIVDRHEAIAQAIALARPGDLVMVAGKGHEKYQVIGNRTLAFDDADVARKALSRRRSNSGVR